MGVSVVQSVATRGWDLPNLQEVQAKSDALEASGFATVHSPMVSQATKQAMAKQVRMKFWCVGMSFELNNAI